MIGFELNRKASYYNYSLRSEGNDLTFKWETGAWSLVFNLASDISEFLLIVILDTEAPRFVSCPADIVWKNGTGNIARVNWDAPVVTDNSGADPSVNSNRQPGSFFTVPGSYEVTYKAVDQGGNENGNCSFRIILECKYFSNWGNGAEEPGVKVGFVMSARASHKCYPGSNL